MNSVERWVEQSQYDFDTAQAMLDSKRYMYVMFCCQQAVEKALKAVIAKQTHEFPPRLTDLVRLAQIAGIDLGEREAFFSDLSNYYTQTCYPDEIEDSGKTITQEVRRKRSAGHKRKLNGCSRY